MGEIRFKNSAKDVIIRVNLTNAMEWNEINFDVNSFPYSNTFLIPFSLSRFAGGNGPVQNGYWWPSTNRIVKEFICEDEGLEGFH